MSGYWTVVEGVQLQGDWNMPWRSRAACCCQVPHPGRLVTPCVQGLGGALKFACSGLGSAPLFYIDFRFDQLRIGSSRLQWLQATLHTPVYPRAAPESSDTDEHATTTHATEESVSTKMTSQVHPHQDEPGSSSCKSSPS